MENKKSKKGFRRVLIAGTLVSLLTLSGYSIGILSGPYYGDKIANWFVHRWDITVKGLECKTYKGNKHIHGDKFFIEEIENAIDNFTDNKFSQTAMSFNTLSQSDEYKCYASLGISYINASDMGLEIVPHAIPYIRDKIGDKIGDKKFINSVLNSVKQKGLQSLLVHLGSFREAYIESLSKQNSVMDKFLHFYNFKNEKEDGFAAQKNFLDSKGIKLTPCSLTCWVSRNYQN